MRIRNHIHATSSPSDSGLLAPIPEEPTQPSTSEFDETDQFSTHEEPDLRHAVHTDLVRRASKKADSLQNQNHLIKTKTCPQVFIFQSLKNYLPTLKRSCITIMLRIAAKVRAGFDPNRRIDDEPEYVKVYCQGDSAKLI